VISGYLITTLLLREADKTQTISFRRFYARRSLRIFPPFYAYLAVLGILWAIGTIPEHLPSFLAAASYTLIYLPHPQGWFIQHAWSLSVEEQFYLLWPLLLLWSYRRRKSVELAVAIIAVMPVVRAILHWIALAQGGDARDAFVVSGSIDTLMAGCLLAMLARHLRWERWRQRYIRGWTAGTMFLVGFIGVPYLTAKLKAGAGSFITIALGETVTSLCIVGILVYLVANERSIAGRFLNAAPVRHIGVISYSLYLWQQLFSGEELRLLPYGYLFALAAAEASFWLIERPVSRLRSRMRV
jgi:peptidoglycan/LPS O-acetylase OafA/YrhL